MQVVAVAGRHWVHPSRQAERRQAGAHPRCRNLFQVVRTENAW